MVNEAHRILKEIDNRVYVKIPVSYEGIKAIKILKAEGINVTATAAYDPMHRRCIGSRAIILLHMLIELGTLVVIRLN